MRLLELEIENLNRFVGVHRIKFPKGLCFLTADNKDAMRQGKGDSNGSGKTSIIRAICWGLFGKCWDGQRGVKLIADDREGGGVLRVKLTISGGYIVERIYTRKGQRAAFTTPEETVRASSSDDDNKGEDITIVDEAIRTHLKIDLKLFSSCLYVSRTSTSVQFLYATPAERSKLLSTMVDDAVFQHAASLLKTQRDSLGTRYTKLTTEKELLEARIAKETRNVEALQASISQAQTAEEARKATIRAKLEKVRAEQDELSRVLLQKCEFSMQELETTRSDIKARLLDNQRSLENCRIISEHNIKSGVQCSLCLSTITVAHREYVLKQNAETKERHKRLVAEQTLWARELSILEQRQEEVRGLDARKAKASSRMETLKHEAAHLSVDLQQTSINLTVLRDRMVTHTEAILEASNRCQEILQKCQDIAAELHVVTRLVTIMSSDVKNMLFDRIRGVLESLTAKRIYELAGSGTVVKFPNTSAGGREQFVIELYDKQKKRDLACWSEGESWRAAFAILLALRETMLIRTGCRLSVLLIDDPLGGLDTTGMKVFVEILRNLTDTAENILVAVPREELLEGDARLHVIRENDLARMEIVQ